MSTPKFIKNKPPSDLIESCDIDLTPMMSMFIMLIPFLVSMAVMTHLTILPFSLPPNVDAGMDISGGKPQIKLTLVVALEYVSITLGDAMLDSIPALPAGGYDFPAITQKLSMHRAEQQNGELVVAVRDDVPVKSVVSIMDRCRDSGFDQIGLSGATINPHAGR